MVKEQMDGGRAHKRRRTVTTCTECARRKQRCNRETPCQHCLQRGVPNKCTYNAETGSPSERDKASGDSRSPITSDQLNDGIPRDESEVDFPEQAGYLLTRGSSSLMHLRESLRDGDAKSPCEITRQSISYPSSLRQQYHAHVKRLPSETLCEQLVTVYFEEANWHFQVLEQWFFNQSYQRWRASLRSPSQHWDAQGPEKLETLYFPALLFQVLATALHFLPPESEAMRALGQYDAASIDGLSEDYSRHGAEIMSCLGRSNATRSGCEHDIIRSLWLKNQGRGYMSWQLLGAAIRQGQELGWHAKAKFHRKPGEDIQQTAARAWMDERERRLWVTLFIWDAHVSMTLNRPRLVNVSDCTTDAPIDCDVPRDPSNTFPGLPEADQAPSSYRSRLFSYDLSRLIHDMYNSHAHRPGGVKDYGKVQSLHRAAMQLVAELPGYLNFREPDVSLDQRYPTIMTQRHHNQVLMGSFLMTLHRDHAATHEESRQLTVQATLDMLDAQERSFWVIKRNQRRIFTFSCYTVDACLVLASVALKSPPPNLPLLRQADESIGRAIERLTNVRECSPLARTGARLLARCQKRIRERVRAADDAMSFMGSGLDPLSTTATTAATTAATTMTGDTPPTTNTTSATVGAECDSNSPANMVTPSQQSSVGMDSLRDDMISFQNGMLDFGDDGYRGPFGSSGGGGGGVDGLGNNNGGGGGGGGGGVNGNGGIGADNFDLSGIDFRDTDFSLGLPLAHNAYTSELFSYMMGQPSAFDVDYKGPV